MTMELITYCIKYDTNYDLMQILDEIYQHNKTFYERGDHTGRPFSKILFASVKKSCKKYELTDGQNWMIFNGSGLRAYDFFKIKGYDIKHHQRGMKTYFNHGGHGALVIDHKDEMIKRLANAINDLG